MLGVSNVDIDECDVLTDNCDNNAMCTNNIGGFTCTCLSGFDGDGVTCSGKTIIQTIEK